MERSTCCQGPLAAADWCPAANTSAKHLVCCTVMLQVQRAALPPRTVGVEHARAEFDHRRLVGVVLLGGQTGKQARWMSSAAGRRLLQPRRAARPPSGKIRGRGISGGSTPRAAPSQPVRPHLAKLHGQLEHAAVPHRAVWPEDDGIPLQAGRAGRASGRCAAAAPRQRPAAGRHGSGAEGASGYAAGL